MAFTYSLYDSRKRKVTNIRAASYFAIFYNNRMISEPVAFWSRQTKFRNRQILTYLMYYETWMLEEQYHQEEKMLFEERWRKGRLTREMQPGYTEYVENVLNEKILFNKAEKIEKKPYKIMMKRGRKVKVPIRSFFPHFIVPVETKSKKYSKNYKYSVIKPKVNISSEDIKKPHEEIQSIIKLKKSMRVFTSNHEILAGFIAKAIAPHYEQLMMALAKFESGERKQIKFYMRANVIFEGIEEQYYERVGDYEKPIFGISSSRFRVDTRWRHPKIFKTIIEDVLRENLYPKEKSYSDQTQLEKYMRALDQIEAVVKELSIEVMWKSDVEKFSDINLNRLKEILRIKPRARKKPLAKERKPD